LSVETYSVATCKEAQELITHCKPHIVFAENSVADGSWVSILNMAEAEDVPLSVVVVGSVPDTRHYVSVLERGAFDFVAPPFEHEPLNFVVRAAALAAHRHREASARADVV
jgi:DNA-binding NtrC family response regulator